MQKHILLIDDDRDELEILNNALETAGIDCVCAWAPGAEQALQMLHDTVPDIIFLDLNMPRINGLACLQEIRKIKELINIPVILYSTSINDETRKRASETGASWCIQKKMSVMALAEDLSIILSDNVVPSHHA
jgi:DNA-binding response OmpR family regulator